MKFTERRPELGGCAGSAVRGASRLLKASRDLGQRLSPTKSLARPGTASFWALPARRWGPGAGMAPAAARWLMLASVHYGALRRGPSLKKDGDISAGRGSGRSLAPSRSVIVTRSGAILPKPVKTPFGLLRVFSIVIPSLYVGTLVSKGIAALLDEHVIFVQEDDDDD